MKDEASVLYYNRILGTGYAGHSVPLQVEESSAAGDGLLSGYLTSCTSKKATNIFIMCIRCSKCIIE